MKLVGATLTGLVALVGTVYAVWGPIWPVPPEILASGADPSSPFVFPLQISNGSVLFATNIDKWECSAKSVDMKVVEKSLDPKLSGNGVIRQFVSTGFPHDAIGTKGAKNYTCMMSISGTPTRSFLMNVTAAYHNILYSGVVKQCFEWINADQNSRWLNSCPSNWDIESN